MLDRSEVRAIVRGTYDIQKLRIQMGNRIVGNLKAKMGQEPGTKEDTVDEKDQKILKAVREQFKTMADGVVRLPKTLTFDLKGERLVCDETEVALINEYVSITDSEKRHFKIIANAVKDQPLWVNYIRDVRGAGPAIAAILISEIDITLCRYPSTMWAYAGLDVASDGRGRGRYKEHQVQREYTTKDGEKEVRNSITFNPFLKTKLLGVLAPSFLKQPAAACKYRQIYDDYKQRLENHEKHKEKTKGHREKMCRRYIVKMFLKDLYLEWRKLEGLPVTKSYHEQKLGHKHGDAA